MRVFTFSFTEPRLFIEWLIHYKIPYRVCSSVGDTLTPKGLNIITTVSLFKQLKKDLPKGDYAVFDAPVLCEMIKHAKKVDFKNLSSYEYRKVDVTRAQFKKLYDDWKSPKKIAKVKADTIIQNLLNSVSNSLISPIHSYIFCQGTEVRAALYKIIFNWLATENNDVSVLKEQLKDNTVQLDDLLKKFETEDGKKLRAAYVQVLKTKATKKPVQYKKLEKQFGISKFEIKYFMKYAIKNINITEYPKDGKPLMEVFKEKSLAKKEKV